MEEPEIGSTASLNELPAFLQPLLDRMHSSARVETVFGPSRQERNRTIVPVGRVAYGMGGGYGTAAAKGRKNGGGQAQADEGGGGGGGINVTPVGVLEVTDAGTRFVPITASKVVAAATFLAGLLIGMVLGRPGRR